MAGAIVGATLVFFAFEFLKEASNKGGVWRGSLHLNEAHRAN